MFINYINIRLLVNKKTRAIKWQTQRIKHKWR